MDHSPGRTNRSGDYLLYDPYKLFLVDAEYTSLSARVVRPHPSGYPTGFTLVESDSDAKAIAEAKNSSVTVVAGSVAVLDSTVISDVLSSDSLSAVRSLLTDLGLSFDGVFTVAEAI